MIFAMKHTLVLSEQQHLEFLAQGVLAYFIMVVLHAAGLKGSTALSQAIITGADKASPPVGRLRHGWQKGCIFDEGPAP